MPTPQPLDFPFKGLNTTAAHHALPQGTTDSALNVRPFDALEGRLRGGRRAGLSKWCGVQINGSEDIQALARVVLPALVPVAERIIITALSPGGSYPTSMVYSSKLESVQEIQISQDTRTTARDSSGNLYVYDEDLEILHKVDAAGATVWSVSITNGNSDTLRFNSQTNKLYLGRSDYYEISPATGLLGSILPVTFGSAIDIIFGVDGAIYVLASTGSTAIRVYKILPSGAVFATYFTTGSTTTYASFAINTAEDTIFLVHGFNAPVIVSIATATMLETAAVYAADYPQYVPVGIASTPDGNIVLAGNANASSYKVAWKINPATGATIWAFGGSDTSMYSSSEVVVDLAGDVYITGRPSTTWDGTDGSNKSFWKLSGDTGSVLLSHLLPDTTQTGGYAGMVIAQDTSQDPSLREQALVGVAGGSVFKIDPSVATLATAGGDAMLSSFGVIQAVPAFGKLFIVDGVNSKYFDLSDDTVKDWATGITGGSLPANARLVALYRGRIILSGIVADAQNWFMSKVSDPFDFDYAPTTVTALDAVAGNNGETGEVGDIITALIPVGDDLMLFGCDSTIWQLTGDPMAGGAIDQISDKTGMAFGASWAKDTRSTIYFTGTDGVYRFVAGQPIQNLTEGRLDSEFKNLDFSSNRIQLEWDVQNKQLWVAITPTLGSGLVQVYIWDQRTDSWWEDQYPSTMGPSGIYDYNADQANDAAFLLGCRDGYVRQVSAAAVDDDGTGITSHVRFAPITPSTLSEKVSLEELEIVLGESSGAVDLEVFTGQTAEQLSDNTTPQFKRVVTAGRNGSIRYRARAAALAVQIGQTAASSIWALGRAAARLGKGGPVKRWR